MTEIQIPIPLAHDHPRSKILDIPLERSKVRMEEKDPPAKIDWAARRKRRKLAWGDLPAFLDASASVSASIFGARRLPELKSMYQELQQDANANATADPPEQCFQSIGGKTSARHLRRRTTSMHRRIRHRFPIGRSKPKEFLTREEASEIATMITTEKVKSTTRRARRNNRLTLSFWVARNNDNGGAYE
jgi:hypothetical protein